MEKIIKLELVTPEHQILSQDVEEVILPGVEGSFGVLPGHEALVAALQPGMLKFMAEGAETIYAIGGGYAEVASSRVIVLADTAERAEDIDVEAARHARSRATAQLKQGVVGKEYDAAEISLKKALAQLQVAEIIHRRGKSGSR